ncbi:MAG: general secretion pathway protein GspK [Bdellovibrionales bacterium]|nr:general secretion pathway protein GspK [Bdellovibrionales bacterium]
MFHPWSKRNKKKGSAMMLAIFTITFVLFLATEISRLTINEYLTSATEVKKVQAYYAAKACLQLSLLRIKAYQQATAALGKSVPNLGMLDMIWRFPLSWPPSLPKELSSFDSSTIKKTVGGSLLKNQFLSSISAEGGKIDINDLGSPSEGLRNQTAKQLLQRLTARVQNNRDDFADRYSNYNFQELINNITDWIDDDDQSLNGGSEKGMYTDFRSDFIPPNRPFKTKEELHMVEGMTDEIYALIEPEITLFGVKGVNVNQAEKDVLLSLFAPYDPRLAEEIVTEILKRRNNPELGGPFKDEKEFLGFLGGYIDSRTFNDDKVPLFFGAEINFRINCTGIVGQMTREIDAVVYDAIAVKEHLQNSLKEDLKNQGPNQGGQDLTEQCKDKQGEEKYKCLCQNIEEGQAKLKCLESYRLQGQNQDQSNKQGQGMRPGPPKMIFLQVK